MIDLATVLAEHQGQGCVVAPAGYGKTHLIAEAVSRATRRQLVLTHTCAGVTPYKENFEKLTYHPGVIE